MDFEVISNDEVMIGIGEKCDGFTVTFLEGGRVRRKFA